MESKPGLRDRKKQAVRQHLSAAAVRLVAERGLRHVTVEEIAQEAEVSVRTFFNYFSSKEEAIVGRDWERSTELRLKLLARPAAESPFEALKQVLIERAKSLGDRPEEWLLHMQVVRQEPSLLPAMVASFMSHERILVEAVAERAGVDPDRDLYPSVVASVALGAFRVAMTQWRSRQGQHSLVHLVETSLSLVQGGLPAPDRRPLPARQKALPRGRVKATGPEPVRPVQPAIPIPSVA